MRTHLLSAALVLTGLSQACAQTLQLQMPMLGYQPGDASYYWMPPDQQAAYRNREEPDRAAVAAQAAEELRQIRETSAGRRYSCKLFNLSEDIDANKIPFPIFGVRAVAIASWCAAQPKAVRRKYGSRY